MCLPGLHISLGIFFRLYTLLEEACHQLDLTAADLNQGQGGASFATYSADIRAISKLRDDVQRSRHNVATLEQLCTLCILTSDPNLQQAKDETKTQKQLLQNMVLHNQSRVTFSIMHS